MAIFNEPQPATANVPGNANYGNAIAEAPKTTHAQRLMECFKRIDELESYARQTEQRLIRLEQLLGE